MIAFMVAARMEPGFALDTRRPFTRADACAAGLDPRLLRGSRFRRLFRGVYVDAEVRLTPRVRAQAGLALHPPDAFVGHHTAAEVRGVPVPTCDRVHVTVARQEERVQQRGIACHIACAEAQVEVVDGVRVSRPLDMFVELAGVLSLVDLVVAGDAMVRMGLFSAAELVAFCAATSRWHARRARRGAAYVRHGVDSPMETRLRMLLVLAGLPEPTVNLRMYHPDGTTRRRLDLAYRSARVGVEFEGRQHADDPDQWLSDIDRREELDEESWRLVLVTSDGIFRRPERTVLRVAAVLRSRGVRLAPLTETWRAHFPGR